MKLAVISGADAVKALRKIGYEFDELEGKHRMVRHRSPPHGRLSIRNHMELAKGTPRALIRQAGLSGGIPSSVVTLLLGSLCLMWRSSGKLRFQGFALLAHLHDFFVPPIIPSLISVD
jgi:predicted RNA binding protein YcfA (HicA-like mRNA interferase family)